MLERYNSCLNAAYESVQCSLWKSHRTPHRKSKLRMQWGILDQALSSLTNFVLSIIVARRTTVQQFGVFGLALTLYISVLWISRSVTTEPFVIRLTASTSEQQHGSARDATGSATLIGFIAGVLLLSAAMLVRFSSWTIFAIMAIGLPGLLLQDSFRYVLFAAGRTRGAALNDLAWFVVQTFVMIILFWTHHADTASLVGAFALGATTAAIIGALQLHMIPLLSRSWPWIRTQRDLGLLFLLELASVAGVTQLSFIVIAGIAGVPALGELRAAMLLFGPLTTLLMGVYTVGVPEAIRVRSHSERSFSTLVLVLGAVLPVTSLLAGGALLLLPARLGTLLLHSNWATARGLVGPVTFLVAGQSSAIGALVGLRAMGAARQSVRLRLWGGPAVLLGATVGAEVAGANGAAVGLGLANWFDALLVWFAFRRACSAATLAPELRISSD